MDEEEDEDAEGETDDEVSIAAPSSNATGTPAFGSRMSTPDMSRMTKRQKSRLDEVYNADLMELPDGFGISPSAPLYFVIWWGINDTSLTDIHGRTRNPCKQTPTRNC